MAELTEPLKEGTLVNIRNSGFKGVRILEYVGPLGPQGARIYTVLAVKKPRLLIDVREDQLEVVDEKDRSWPFV
jgi:hypothetical protein